MFKNSDELREWLLNNGYEDVMIFENYDYASAFIGVSYDNVAIYDYDKMIEFLKNEGMSEEDAADFIDYNSSFSGEGYPIIMYPCKI